MNDSFGTLVKSSSVKAKIEGNKEIVEKNGSMFQNGDNDR